MMKTEKELVNILKRIGENVFSEILLPIRLNNSPNYLYLEIVTGEERDNGQNDCVCFGFRMVENNLIYDSCVFPINKNEEYKGNDFSIEALTKYTINKINNHKKC